MNTHDDTPRCTCCWALLWDTELQAARLACYRCEDTATEKLRTIRTTFKRLDTLDGHTKERTGASSPTAGTDAPAPIRLAVLNQTAAGGVVTQLQAIEDAWRKALEWQMGATRHHADIDGATTFLINNLPWACERYEEIAEDFRTIHAIADRLRGLETGEPGPKKFTAYCGIEDCDGEMRISLATPRATCRTCGAQYDKQALAQLVTEYDDRSAA